MFCRGMRTGMGTTSETIRIPWVGWKLGRRLGSGSFGMVYEIERTVGTETERAALKVISFPKEGMVEDLESEGYPLASIRRMCDSCKADLLREYGVMMQLKGHSNIVSCEDFTTEDMENGTGFRMYIRMELLQPLRDVLRQGNLSEKEVIRLGRDLCRALSICHGMDIIHRDIKPQNIFRSHFGDYKLGDFGIARRMEGTEKATVAGTTNYMAPEVYHHEPYGKDADLYSLGMVLYYLLNDRRMPFLSAGEQIPSLQEESRAMLRRVRGEKIPAPAGGSPALQEIVLRAVAYDRNDRYRSAEEMLAALESLQDAPVGGPVYDGEATSAGDETVSLLSRYMETGRPAREEQTFYGQKDVENEEILEENPGDETMSVASVFGRGRAEETAGYIDGRDRTGYESGPDRTGYGDRQNRRNVQARLSEQAGRQAVQAEQGRNAAGLPIKKFLPVIIAAILVLVVGVAVVTLRRSQPEKQYQEALALADAGSYEEAIEAFEEIGDYKDVADRIKDCYYQRGILHAEAGEYQEAIEDLRTAGDYKDAADQINKCHYQRGSLYAEAGEYQEAIEAFKAAGSYEDAEDRIVECLNGIYGDIYGDLVSAGTGNTVKFGHYEQDNNKDDGKEEIEWVVLDKTVSDQGVEALLLSKYALDCVPYSREDGDVTWAYSYMREWLNEKFVNKAFNDQERSLIAEDDVSVDSNPVYPTMSGDPVQDQVFLLSTMEAEKYFSSNSARECRPTGYAVARGAYTARDGDEKGNCIWWLRTPGDSDSNVARVYVDGEVHYQGIYANDNDDSVRPAVRIRIETDF